MQGLDTKILDTRKTAPGLRYVDKLVCARRVRACGSNWCCVFLYRYFQNALGASLTSPTLNCSAPSFLTVDTGSLDQLGPCDKRESTPTAKCFGVEVVHKLKLNGCLVFGSILDNSNTRAIPYTMVLPVPFICLC